MQKHFRTLRLVLTFLFLTLVFSSCADEEVTKAGSRFPNAYSAEDSWLISWYICGSDLESEYGAASADIEELLETDLPPNVRVLIFAGGTHEWQNELFRADKGNLYLYDADGLHQVDRLNNVDMGDEPALWRGEFLCRPQYIRVLGSWRRECCGGLRR